MKSTSSIILFYSWLTSPRWMYTLYLMMDGNFRLKLKDCGAKDVHLAPGWVYYVEDNKFEDHFAKFADLEPEINECSAEHKAIAKANKHRLGYLASGEAAVLCNRHVLVRPCTVGDLKKGEKCVHYSLHHIVY